MELPLISSYQWSREQLSNGIQMDIYNKTNTLILKSVSVFGKKKLSPQVPVPMIIQLENYQKIAPFNPSSQNQTYYAVPAKKLDEPKNQGPKYEVSEFYL